MLASKIRKVIVSVLFTFHLSVFSTFASGSDIVAVIDNVSIFESDIQSQYNLNVCTRPDIFKKDGYKSIPQEIRNFLIEDFVSLITMKSIIKNYVSDDIDDIVADMKAKLDPEKISKKDVYDCLQKSFPNLIDRMKEYDVYMMILLDKVNKIISDGLEGYNKLIPIQEVIKNNIVEFSLERDRLYSELKNLSFYDTRY